MGGGGGGGDDSRTSTIGIARYEACYSHNSVGDALSSLATLRPLRLNRRVTCWQQLASCQLRCLKKTARGCNLFSDNREVFRHIKFRFLVRLREFTCDPWALSWTLSFALEALGDRHQDLVSKLDEWHKLAGGLKMKLFRLLVCQEIMSVD